MDNLAHSLVGIHLSRIRPFRGVPDRAAMWTCIAASNLPDVDLLLRLRGDTELLFGHGGVTHSLLGLLVLAPAVALAAALLTRLPLREVLPGLVAVAFAGLAGHLALDALTGIGVQLFAPFAPARISLPWLYHADPWVLAALVVPLLWARWKKGHGVPARVLSQASAFTLLAVAIYVGACGLAREKARYAAVAQLPDELGSPREVLAFPAPFGPLIWTTLIRTDQEVWVRGFASVLTGGVTPGGTFETGREDPRVQVALATPLGARFGALAAAPYRAMAQGPAEDGSMEVAIADLGRSNPFSDRLPMALWIRLGPHFDVEGYEVRTALLPP
ncbi:metal-dependent hydrolase [Vulgatibacter incomptus]|uniref:Membrane-bound metal-dependent hydrolase n=1 Tax=Vulgatibacter incomptus TaxID=1391653 RepID=A0A0K1PHB8_9BACT|nr:metal-dependent hydrolase [Vulgatibacter incomptus]AKU92915.1 Membrane-bound metal-dependent hydrolase [Vulgatibacter incomptus]